MDVLAACPFVARGVLWQEAEGPTNLTVVCKATCSLRPVILEQMDTTTVVPPDFQVACDAWGNLILTQLHEGQ